MEFVNVIYNGPYGIYILCGFILLVLIIILQMIFIHQYRILFRTYKSMYENDHVLIEMNLVTSTRMNNRIHDLTGENKALKDFIAEQLGNVKDSVVDACQTK